MDNNHAQTSENAGYLHLPGVTGGGVLVHQNQIVGARPNGPDQGAIVYTKAGPSLYTSLTTTDLAQFLGASKIAHRG